MAKPHGGGRRRPSNRTNLASCAVATVFLLFLLAVLLIVYFTVFKPKDPKISVNAVQLPSFAVSNNTANFTFSQYVAVRNPNRAVFSHYDSSIQLLYSGNQVGFMFIPAGKIDSGRTQYMAATFTVQSFPISPPPPSSALATVSAAVIPDSPAMPGPPDFTVTPGSPKIPDSPDFPGDPETPDFPGNPGTPSFPRNPGSPDFPGNSGSPILPRNPGSPEFSGNGNPPRIPGSPVFQGNPGSRSMGPPGFPGIGAPPGFPGTGAPPGFPGTGAPPGFSGGTGPTLGDGYANPGFGYASRVGPTMEIESKMELVGRVKVLHVFTHHVVAKSDCRVTVSITDGSVLGFHC
ncbi:hypothetical protein EUTSA_v10023571mg [Eutrema salsugineum]|uniref:Late embryogenesis abundant protein LEA-2 subgroup domain-containing protein n=1 Tax=Eutrema salsugineum TaxID=72664 RepID=V4KGE0_EUTSA|nr:collagen alpha-3(IV) chain [Eutrema salsugineum]ESQ28902.1 hypothetical protein EUTSA_v10023571mg [Eutrema salsugineum]